MNPDSQIASKLLENAAQTAFNSGSVGAMLAVLVILVFLFFVFYRMMITSVNSNAKQTREIIKEERSHSAEMTKYALEANTKTALEVAQSMAREIVREVGIHFNQINDRLDQQEYRIDNGFEDLNQKIEEVQQAHNARIS